MSPCEVLNTFTLLTSPANVSNFESLMFANDWLIPEFTFEPLSILKIGDIISVIVATGLW